MMLTRSPASQTTLILVPFHPEHDVEMLIVARSLHTEPQRGTFSAATIETRTRMAILAAENLLAMLRGERCQHLLNPEVLKKS